MTRLYGRAPKGRRVRDAVPLLHWEVTSLLMSLRPNGAYTAMTIPTPVTGEIFQVYVEQILVPSLGCGDVVIWDNLPAHKVQGAQAALARVPASLEYLPPYSSDFCPLDQCFAKVKTFLRTVEPRTHHALDRALREGLASLTVRDVKDCFAHCGYPV
jgi:transposase